MVSVISSSRMSAQEYLVWERSQEEKHDWYHGDVFAMAGGTMRHARLTAGIIAELASAFPDRSHSVRCAAARAVCSRRI